MSRKRTFFYYHIVLNNIKSNEPKWNSSLCIFHRKKFAENHWIAVSSLFKSYFLLWYSGCFCLHGKSINDRNFCFYQKLYHYMHLPPAVPICEASNICTIVHCDCPTSLPLYPSQPLINLYSAALSLNQLFLRPLSSLSPQRAAVPWRKPLKGMFYYDFQLPPQPLPACSSWPPEQSKLRTLSKNEFLFISTPSACLQHGGCFGNKYWM